MKTIKKRLPKSKSKHTKKLWRRMTGGSLDGIVMSNTLKVLKNTANYLQIDGIRRVYYTSIRFDLTETIINDLIRYGINPGLGGSIIDTSQPYIIYFFIYYYISKVFSEFFKMKDQSGKGSLDLYLLPDTSDPSSELSKKGINNDLDIMVGRSYCIFANLSKIPSAITFKEEITYVAIRFIVKSGDKVKKKNTLSELLITGIFMLDNVPENVSLDTYHRDIITKISDSSRNDLSTLYTPVRYSKEVRDKIVSIVLYSIDIEKQLISAQSTNTELHFITLTGSTHLKFNPVLYSNMEIPHHMSATFLTFINKLSTTLKSDLSGTMPISETNKLSSITENYIPNVLNIYLSTPSYSQIKLDNILLKRDMFPPYSSSSNELQINPRYDFTKMKSTFTKQFCKSNKGCYIDTLYSFSEFTKFNKQNKSGKRLQTIQQVTPNVTGNIETTLSLLLSNSTLKINGEELVITDYNWNNQWKLMGPKENLLSLQPQNLQNKLPDIIIDTQKCYKNILEFYDDLIELFYPSMSGKDITKIYGNYLKILNDRNILLNDVKKFVNKKTLSIKTVNLSSDDKNKLSTIKTKSIILNEYINKFVESILYQLIIIGNLTRKIINKIHSPCFFYFGFDNELYPNNKSNNSINLPTSSHSKLMTLIPNITALIITDDPRYNIIRYIEDYLSPMYYSSSEEYNEFFNSLLCGNLIIGEYTSIIQSFSNIIKTVFEQLDKIAGRMIEIKNDTSYETVNLSNETLSKLWISDENIERVFSEFGKNVRNFIKYNLTDSYYSKPIIEKWIDDNLWDMEKSNGYTYCRLFTTFVYNNVWQQFEILFSLKVLQYIFLIYQYTGKYLYYKHIQNNNISNDFLNFLENPLGFNLFSCVVNWFKYNCMVQIQNFIQTKETITIREIQHLFATNELIIGSYALMKYYITQIILTNLDVCQLTTELQTFVDALSPTDVDLRNIMPQTMNENEQNPPETDKKMPETDKKDNEPNSKILSYNVQVQVKVKKVQLEGQPKETLNSNNIYEYLGCKNRDLQFQLNKLKQSTGILTGDIKGYISKQTASLGGPNIAQLKSNLNLRNGSQNEKDYIISLFYNPNSMQILSSMNLSETKGGLDQNNLLVNVNKLVYAINVETKKMVKGDGVFLTVKNSNGIVSDIINNQIFGLLDTLYAGEH